MNNNKKLTLTKAVRGLIPSQMDEALQLFQEKNPNTLIKVWFHGDGYAEIIYEDESDLKLLKYYYTSLNKNQSKSK